MNVGEIYNSEMQIVGFSSWGFNIYEINPKG
jgi:hypothetical protein